MKMNVNGKIASGRLKNSLIHGIGIDMKMAVVSKEEGAEFYGGVGQGWPTPYRW